MSHAMSRQIERCLRLVDADHAAGWANDASGFHGHIAHAASDVQYMHSGLYPGLQQNASLEVCIEFGLLLKSGEFTVAMPEGVDRSAILQ